MNAYIDIPVIIMLGTKNARASAFFKTMHTTHITTAVIIEAKKKNITLSPCPI